MCSSKILLKGSDSSEIGRYLSRCRGSLAYIYQQRKQLKKKSGE